MTGSPASDGGVRPRRFLAVTLPAALVALAMVPATIFGWVTVVITSAHPIRISTSEGTAGSVQLVQGNDGTLTRLAPSASGGGGMPLLELSDSRLDDLCLAPRLEVPVVGGLFGLRIRTGRAVDIGRITLASTETVTEEINLPTTRLGFTDGAAVRGGPEGATFSLGTVPGEERAELRDAQLEVYGLVLSDGLMIRSLTLSGPGDGRC